MAFCHWTTGTLEMDVSWRPGSALGWLNLLEFYQTINDDEGGESEGMVEVMKTCERERREYQWDWRGAASLLSTHQIYSATCQPFSSISQIIFLASHPGANCIWRLVLIQNTVSFCSGSSHTGELCVYNHQHYQPLYLVSFHRAMLLSNPQSRIRE